MNQNTQSENELKTPNIQEIDFSSIKDDGNEGYDSPFPDQNDHAVSLPFTNGKRKNKSNQFDLKDISEGKLKLYQKMLRLKAENADRMDKHFYKRKGLHLIVVCIILYLVIVTGDSLLSAKGYQISSYADGFVELLKFLISTLIGYVFVDSVKHKEKKDETDEE